MSERRACVRCGALVWESQVRILKRTLLLLTILLSACGSLEPTPRAEAPTQTATWTLTVTPSATASRTRLHTQTPASTVTLVPTHTPRPLATPTAAATWTPTHTPQPLPTPTTTSTPATPIQVLGSVSEEIHLELVEQIGGDSLAIALDQGGVYLGIGPRVVVLSGPSAPTNLQPLGQSEVLPGIVQDVTVADSVAYVAAGTGGLVLLGVADPATIRTLGTVSLPSDALGIAVDPENGLAYVVGGRQTGPADSGFLSIIGVSEPQTPKKLASVEIPGPARKVTLIEHYAYVLYEGGLLVVDVHDPGAPTQVVRLDTPQGTRTLAAAAGYVYVAGYGLQVIDVSTPAVPRQVGISENRLPIGALAVWGQQVYLADTFCEWGHCGSTIRVGELSDPSTLQEIGTWTTDSAVTDLAVHEGALYVASWQKGLQVISLSDPVNPSLMGEYGTLPNVEDVAAADDLVYVSDGAQLGLQAIEIGVSGLRFRGIAEPARWANGYTIVDGYAYVPLWLDGFCIVDVRDPDDPQEVADVDLGVAEQAAVVGKQAYVTIGYEGLAVLDVTDPAAPRVVGQLSLNGLAEGLAVGGEHAYVTVQDGQHRLYVVDVTGPSGPLEVSQVGLEGRPANVAVDLETGTAYVAVADCTWYLGSATCSGGLQVVDVRDPTSPQAVVLVEVPGGALDVALAGSYAFVAAGEEGVWVLDVSEPGDLRAVGWVDTSGWASSLAMADDLVYVADSVGGLLVLQARR
jgi:hypothetical protein